MRVIRSRLVVFGLAAAMATAMASASVAPVSALPLGPVAGGSELAAQLDRAAPTIQVRHRGGGIAAGIIGGMILGGIIASQRPYYYYDDPPPYYVHRRAPYGYDPDIAYCMRRFKSYDPYSMTYLGYDGFRHPCP